MSSLLVDVLRGEMGFRGFVTSDWGAIHDYDYPAKGLDMEMGGRPPLSSPFGALGFVYFDLKPPVASIGDKKAGFDRQIDFTKARALPAGSSHVWEGTLTAP